MSITRFLVLVGLALVLMLLGPYYDKKDNRKAGKLARLCGILTIALALVKGFIVMVSEVAHVFWSI